MFFFFILYTFFNSCSTSYALRSKKILAIVCIESSSLSIAETKQIISKLRNELNKNNQLKIVSEKKTTKVLKNFGFNHPSDLYKNDDIIKIGTELGVAKVLTGLAVKMNDLIILTIKITDVKTGESIEAVSSCSGSFEKYLNLSIEELVEKILMRL